MAVLKEAEELLKKWNGGFGALKTPKPGLFVFAVQQQESLSCC